MEGSIILNIIMNLKVISRVINIQYLYFTKKNNMFFSFINFDI